MRRTFLSILVLTTLCLLGSGFYNHQTATALSGSDFQAGYIIDDPIFFNPNLLGGVSEIQAFLNSKVPSCDTNGDQPYAGTTRRDYAATKGVSPPFTCLKDYRQDTPNIAAEANLCNTYTGGNKSSAQIIFDVAQSCNINPGILIVLLQKEQNLVTDDWPWPIQYRSATGYGCPDTAPCDSQYYGLFNQLYNAARQFRYYRLHPDYFQYRSGRSNFILYNPNSACGGSNVFIQNPTTAGLYNYTPYQPNQAALNNLYGLGDGCSAYGNRNFWRIFNEWFGSTLTSARVTVTRIHISTDKTGTAATIGFSLNQPPSSPVTIPVHLSDTTKASFLSPQQVTITADTWNRPDLNKIMVYGLNDVNQHGAVQYQLITDTPITNDAQFRLLTGEFIEDITLTNFDNTNLNVSRLFSPSTHQHIYTTNSAEKTSLVSSGYNDEGIAFGYCKSGENAVYRLKKASGESFLVGENSGELNSALQAGYSIEAPELASSRAARIPVYRLYNPTNGDHFYTVSPAERDSAKNLGYSVEGAVFGVCAGAQEPVYRLYNSITGDHFYTADPVERNWAGAHGYYQEGVGFYLCSTQQSVTVYRLFNPKSGTHFYTASVLERDQSVANGYQNEGTSFNLCSTTDSPIYRLFSPKTDDHFYTANSIEAQTAQSLGYSPENSGLYTSP